MLPRAGKAPASSAAALGKREAVTPEVIAVGVRSTPLSNEEEDDAEEVMLDEAKEGV